MVRMRLDGEPTLIGERTARFRDPAHRAETPLPFPALVRDPERKERAPGDFPVRPLFADTARRRVVLVEGEPGTSYYGTGECAGPLERSGRSVTCWNTDCSGYDGDSPSLYQSHPWVFAVRRDGSAYGVMVETTWRCRVTTGAGILFECEGPSPRVTVIDGASPPEVVKRLAELTGFMPMPPRWALGYQQCRWSYEPQARVLELAQRFREKRIPCDVIWMDIDYMDGFRCFTFDTSKFPDAGRLNHDLHALGFRAVWMIDPGIKADPGYEVYAQGRERGHFVRTGGLGGVGRNRSTTAAAPSDGAREYHGAVWPGACAFPDFTNERVREWWAGLYGEFLSHGIDGVWNDMNEPAVFDGPGKTMPETNRHAADESLGGPGDHARFHNVYGMLMARATREGIERARPGKRPFVLTRSNFLGGQRYAATWTGDNLSAWAHLGWSIPMVLNLGLSGQPFCGPDIGGFEGNATPELFARWMGIGALLPFARGHSIKGSADHEPWSFGEACERACRLALERRYRLLPYLYTLFREAHRSGMPIARPVFFADAKDAGLRGVDDAFLLGGDVLVAADCARATTSGPVDAPAGGALRRAPGSVLAGWRPFEPASGRCDDLPALFVRPGAIVPMGPAMQRVDEVALDPLTLVVCPDEHGRAEGVLYEDSGDGAADARDWCLTRFEYEGGELRTARIEGEGTRRFGAVAAEVLGAHDGVSCASLAV